MTKKLLFILLLLISFIGFSQEKPLESLSAAPNPFTNTTQIVFSSSFDSSIQLTVINILGTTVFKKTYKTKVGKNIIPFYKNDLAPGMYIYSIQYSNSIISKRFVIK
tara:strand:- start:2454 stop:2774 length:321 start_codon:yes stop_codon:yes gene_type:complete